jgi:signal transduction histidine kinase
VSAEVPAGLQGLPEAAVGVVAGRVTWANDAFVVLTGLPAAQVVGGPPGPWLELEQAGDPRAFRRRGRLVASGTWLEVVASPSSAQGAVWLLRPLAEPSPGCALAPALARAALRVRWQPSREAVLEAAVQGLAQAGLWGGLLLVQGERLVLDRTAMPPWAKEAMERVLKGPLLGWQRPLAEVPLAVAAFAQKHLVRSTEFDLEMQRLYGGPEAAARALPIAGALDELLMAPLHLEGKPLGVLSAMGRPFSDEDLAAVELFCAEVGAALEAEAFVRSLERRNQQLQLLNRLARELVVHDLPRGLQLAVQTLAPLAHADVAALHLREGESGLALAAVQGSSEGLQGAEGLLEACARAGGQLTLTGDEAGRALPGCQHAAVQLLQRRGRPVGLIALGRRTQPFEPDTCSLLETASAQLGVALENSELYRSAQRQVQQLRLVNEVARRISGSLDPLQQMEQALAAMCEVLGFDAGAGAFWGGDAPAPLVVQGLPRALAWAALVSLVARLPHLEGPVALASLGEEGAQLAALGFQRIVVVPLGASEAARGAFYLLRRSPSPVPGDDLSTLASVASQLALAVEKARLFEQAQRRLSDLERVQAVSEAMTGTLELDELLDRTAVHLASLVGAEEAALYLTDRDGRLQPAAPRRPPGALSLAADPEALAVLEQALSRRRLSVGQGGPRALLALPLLHRDRLVGAALIRSADGVVFQPEAIQRSQVIAQQVAAAVENARLYDDLKRSYEALTRAQDQLVQRERLAALGELSAVVAHEVRNPLGVIFNSMSSLRKLLGPVQGDLALLLQIVSEEADRLNRIVGDLLSFTRGAVPQLEPSDLRDLVGAMVEIARISTPDLPELAVELEVEPGLTPVLLDARLFRQALLNIVLNAIQAMPRGGKLTVRVKTGRLKGQRAALLEVSDTGPGIPPALQGRIFEPFFTTKATGTGLGLAVVKRIVEDHRGEVRVDSQPGLGTTFTLVLPHPEEGTP